MSNPTTTANRRNTASGGLHPHHPLSTPSSPTARRLSRAAAPGAINNGTGTGTGVGGYTGASSTGGGMSSSPTSRAGRRVTATNSPTGGPYTNTNTSGLGGSASGLAALNATQLMLSMSLGRWVMMMI